MRSFRLKLRGKQGKTNLFPNLIFKLAKEQRIHISNLSSLETLTKISDNNLQFYENALLKMNLG